MVVHREREYVADVPATYVERDTPVDAMPWSPLQIIGMLVGVGFTVLGIVAVARTGFDTAHIYTPRVTVWHIRHNPLLGVIEIGFGVLMIVASAIPGGLRTLIALLGAAALVFGIVTLAGPPRRIDHWLAVAHANGVLYTVVGAVVVLAAILSPVFFAGRAGHGDRVRTLA